MKPIFITGYMASGKTTLGKALARRLGREFVDLDFYIEQRFRRSIAQIFDDRGEAGFREMEMNMLREVGEMENLVISCGGGTPCYHDNMAYMNSRGTTVYLNTSEECIFRRLVINRKRRPLLAAMTDEEVRDYIHTHISERLSHYESAQISFCGDELENVRQIDNSVEQLISLMSGRDY